MIHEAISDLIKIELAHVYQFDNRGEVQLYEFDSDVEYNGSRYGGYIRQIRSNRVNDNTIKNYWKTDYKLVLFVNKNKCLDDVKNIIANIDGASGKGDFLKIEVNTVYLDNLSNIKQEFKKLKDFGDKKVIIADISIFEIFCKTKINC